MDSSSAECLGNMSLEERYERLKRFIKEKGEGGVVIALSGGVDSSTLAAVCHNVLGDKAIAVTAVSPTYSLEELEEAKRVADEIGIKHYLIETHELSNENFRKNTKDRCYYCKRELLSRLLEFTRKIGFKAVFEGTNFSDLSDHRPGFRAVEEAEEAFSPWVKAGFTKEDVRELARRMGLSIYDKPQMACLASRIPFGERITVERLKRIEEAERLVKKVSKARQVRVRDHNGLARIEVGKDERHLFFDVKVMDEIAEGLKKLGFKFSTLDLEGYRSGSMLIASERY